MVLTPKQSRRFWAKVDKTSSEKGCWLWTGAARTDGYGLFRISPGIGISAHRLSFMIAQGDPPSEKPCVLHRCDVKRCVNPEHLFAGSKSDNTQDMVAKGRHPSTLQPEKHRGTRNGNATLTEGEVIAIRSDYAAGGLSFGKLGACYGVSKNQIQRIVQRKLWRHI